MHDVPRGSIELVSEPPRRSRPSVRVSYKTPRSLRGVVTKMRFPAIEMRRRESESEVSCLWLRME